MLGALATRALRSLRAEGAATGGATLPVPRYQVTGGGATAAGGSTAACCQPARWRQSSYPGTACARPKWLSNSTSPHRSREPRMAMITSWPLADATPTKQRFASRVQPVLPMTLRSSRHSMRLVERSEIRRGPPLTGSMTSLRVDRMPRMPGVCSAARMM